MHLFSSSAVEPLGRRPTLLRDREAATGMPAPRRRWQYSPLRSTVNARTRSGGDLKGDASPPCCN
jgi:hypothetical protein